MVFPRPGPRCSARTGSSRLRGSLPFFLSYEPELFPGLIYRMIKPRIVLLIFVSGKVVLTGEAWRGGVGGPLLKELAGSGRWPTALEDPFPLPP